MLVIDVEGRCGPVKTLGLPSLQGEPGTIWSLQPRKQTKAPGSPGTNRAPGSLVGHSSDQLLRSSNAQFGASHQKKKQYISFWCCIYFKCPDWNQSLGSGSLEQKQLLAHTQLLCRMFPTSRLESCISGLIISCYTFWYQGRGSLM